MFALWTLANTLGSGRFVRLIVVIALHCCEIVFGDGVIVEFLGGDLLRMFLLDFDFTVEASDLSPLARWASSLSSVLQGRMHVVCKEVLQLGCWFVFVWKDLKKFARSEIIYVELRVLRVLL